MRTITLNDAEEIVTTGSGAFIKSPSPVWMKRVEEDCKVVTDSGTLQAKAGDWLCYDPISQHVWPTSNVHKNEHYAPASRAVQHPTEYPKLTDAE
jgi:hypothetical protein